MARAWLWAGGIAAVAGVAIWRAQIKTDQTALFDPPIRQIEPAPLCPWREPEADLRLFFPEAVRYETETHILSGRRVELAQELGRLPEPEENVLTLYRVFDRAGKAGLVMTKRAKGEHGAIEVVLALDQQNRIAGVRLQRLREPPAIASHLQDSAWLARFQGKTHLADSGSELAASLPEEARVSGLAIIESARALLIMNALVSGQPPGSHSGESHPASGKH